MDIVAEIDHDELWGATGALSVPALVVWKTGVSPRNADTIVAIAQRIEEFPISERADWWWYQPFQPHPPPPTTH